MSEHVHPVVHPDADALGALAEGALSEHERLACVAHLAECSRCREIVYLAQSAAAAEFTSETPVSAPVLEAPIIDAPIRIRKRWFAPLPAFTAVAAAFALVALIAVYRQNKIVAPSPDLTASTRAPVETPAALETTKQPPALESTPAIAGSRARPNMMHEPVEAASPAAIAETPPAPAPPPASQETLAADTGGKVMPVAPAAATQPEQSVEARNSGTPVELSGVIGTVTDPAGAAVAGAKVQARSLTTGTVYPAQTNVSGQFTLSELPPGAYGVQVTVPGFKTYLRNNINLDARVVARLDMPLQVGATSDSVTITAEAPLLKTESGELAHNTTLNSLDSLPVLNPGARADTLSIAALALPDKLPPPTTVSKDKLTLAVDSTGALLLSKDGGKSWKPIKGGWPGKVVRLDTIQDPANARNTLFQLTTDSASIWLSRDGSRWYSAPVRK